METSQRSRSALPPLPPPSTFPGRDERDGWAIYSHFSSRFENIAQDVIIPSKRCKLLRCASLSSGSLWKLWTGAAEGHACQTAEPGQLRPSCRRKPARPPGPAPASDGTVLQGYRSNTSWDLSPPPPPRCWSLFLTTFFKQVEKLQDKSRLGS